MRDRSEELLDSPMRIPPVARAARALVAITAVHGLFAFVSWFRLPPSIPVHFDATGAADAFGPPTVGSWFLLFFVSSASTLLMLLVAASMFRIPTRFLSVPRKREFVALSADRRRRLLAIISFHTLVLALTMSVVFMTIQAALVLAAYDLVARFPTWIVLAATALMLAEIVVMIAAFSRGVEKEIAASVEETAPR